MADLRLIWYCLSCGDSEYLDIPHESAYKRGDWEKCECGKAMLVMAVAEAAMCATALARGRSMSFAEVEAMLRKPLSEAADE